MKSVYTIFFLAVTFFSYGQMSAKPGQTLNLDSFNKEEAKKVTGTPFPHFIATDGETTVSNKSLQGKVVLINFWFEACKPCVAEFGALNELYEILKDRKEFVFISFTPDDAQTIKRVKENYQLPYRIFHVSQEECYRLNQGAGFPLSIILGKDGRIRYFHGGGQATKEKAKEFVMDQMLPKIKAEL